MRYRVRKVDEPVAVNGVWEKKPWDRIEPLALRNHMGDRPEHFPTTEAKLAYDGGALYVIFRVQDRYVRAVAKAYQDGVCRDSCVEFFFVPGEDIRGGYFNLEINCGGTALFHFQKVPRQARSGIPEADFKNVRIAASLPHAIDPEIAVPTIWTLEYALPFDILRSYREFAVPAKGIKWKANLYKCGDATSHPHWLTWAPVKWPKPDFHRPEFFGVIEFD